MRLRYQLVLPLAAFCLALAIAPALAAKNMPSGAPTSTAGAGPTAPAPACILGQPGIVGYYPGFDFFYPPDDAYYTLLDPVASGCPTCTFGLKITAAHWFLYFGQACTVPVEVSIVGVLPTTEVPPCYIPDPSNVLAPPFAAVLDGSGGSFQDCTIPMSHQCLLGPAFLCINMKTPGDCPLDGQGAMMSPSVVVDGSPDNCTTYNIYPGSGVNDFVAFYGFPGNLSMWADADCCPDPTPTLPGTWGRLKTLYR